MIESTPPLISFFNSWSDLPKSRKAGANSERVTAKNRDTLCYKLLNKITITYNFISRFNLQKSVPGNSMAHSLINLASFSGGG